VPGPIASGGDQQRGQSSAGEFRVAAGITSAAVS
jgi:hypothetical protein